MKYKAFISYRHSENGRRHAVALETALKRYAKPTLARPMKIFRDEKHMKPDVSLPKLIRDGLENSGFLIFLAEKSSAESQWCGEELEYWCDHLQRTDRLLIALIDDDIALDGTNGIDWERTTALPALLRPHLTSIPLYMDLRWAKSATDTDLQHPKYRHEINALAARLRGMNPEDLNDEEIRVFRRNIRLRNGAIGVLVAMLLIALGATWQAYTQQKIAQKQTLLANEKTGEAQRNLDRAIAEKGRTKQVLIQVQEQKKATEAQRQIAQKNFENAERERKRAEIQLIATKLSATRKLPDNFDALIPLDSLNCKDWGLGFIPAEIGKLRNLKWLDLRGNQLTELPAAIGNLRNLRSLNAGFNKLTGLPAAIGHLRKLETLELRSNKIDTLPAEIGHLQRLQTFDLQDNLLNDLPAEIGNLHSLRTLSLWKNRLQRLPPEIGQLRNLQLLDVRANLIDSLPAGIGELHRLCTLELGNNRLRSLPAAVGNLERLQSLRLWNNQLSHLPAEIGNLTNLSEMELDDNRLIAICPEIGRLAKLEDLGLSRNHLNNLPATMTNLRNLRSLDLAGNHFTTLPIDLLQQMPALKQLSLKTWLGGNPLKQEEVDTLRKALPKCEIEWKEK